MKFRFLTMLTALLLLCFSVAVNAADEALEQPATATTSATSEPAANAHTEHNAESAKHMVGATAADKHEATADAHDKKGGHDKEPSLMNPDFGSSVVAVVVFGLLLLVLGKFAWKPILAGLKTREEAIRNAVEGAAKAKSDAEIAGRELEAKMVEVQRQASQQLAQAKVDAQKLADSIKHQAEADSLALKDRTLKDIDAAKSQAISEINAHAADLGLAVARRILQRNVTVDDQNRLVEESLAEIARKN